MTDRSVIVQLNRRFGGSSVDAVLDPLCTIFSTPSIEGIIGYFIYHQCAVVYGDPICDEKDELPLVKAFHESCKARKLSVVYLIVSKRFATLAMEYGLCGARLEFGQLLILDPHNDPRNKTGTHACLVRRKVKQATNLGVTVHELLNGDPLLEKAMEEAGDAWLNNRKGPQVHISHVNLFNDRLGKRWFYAKKDEKIIGTVVLNELQKYKGFHLNHLMYTPEAPNGTSELLVASVLETLKRENCHFLSFGTATTPELGEVVGLSPLATFLSRKIFKMANNFFQLDKKKVFWDKFDPINEPCYLLFDKSRIRISQLLGLKRALNVRLK